FLPDLECCQRQVCVRFVQHVQEGPPAMVRVTGHLQQNASKHIRSRRRIELCTGLLEAMRLAFQEVCWCVSGNVQGPECGCVLRLGHNQPRASGRNLRRDFKVTGLYTLTGASLQSNCSLLWIM